MELSNYTVFDREGNFQNLVKNEHGIVGFEFEFKQPCKLIIERVGLQLGGVAELLHPIPLMWNSNTYVLSWRGKLPRGGYKWVDCGLTIDSEHKRFFLTYNQNILETNNVMAVSLNRDLSKHGCVSCSGGAWVKKWQQLNDFVEVTPCIMIDEKPKYSNINNFGLNFDVTLIE